MEIVINCQGDRGKAKKVGAEIVDALSARGWKFVSAMAKGGEVSLRMMEDDS